MAIYLLYMIAIFLVCVRVCACILKSEEGEMQIILPARAAFIFVNIMRCLCVLLYKRRLVLQTDFCFWRFPEH